MREREIVIKFRGRIIKREKMRRLDGRIERREM